VLLIQGSQVCDRPWNTNAA